MSHSLQQMPPLLDTFKRHALVYHERIHYPYQARIIKAIIDGMEASRRGETVEIPIELPRQAGKTTAVVDVVEFLLCVWKEYYGDPLPVGIFAPQKEQASTDFDRLKVQFTDIHEIGYRTKAEVDGDLKFPSKWNSQTVRIFNEGTFYGESYVFPISKTSNPESKTLGLIILEEAQLIYDEKMKRAVFPMGASTNAPRIFIGTAGTRLCYFKTQLDTNPRAIRITLDEVFNDRRAVYEQTKNPYHLRYEQFVNHEIKVNGADSDYIKTQYKGVWVIGTGQFCTTEQLDELEDDDYLLPNKSDKPCYVGIDTAKSPDQTVVWVIEDREEESVESNTVGVLTLKGENYEDQFEIITDWLNNFTDVRGIAIDATGQGDFMPDKFERHTAYQVYRVPFSQMSKDMIYKQLLQVIHNKLTKIPGADRAARWYIEWRTEMLNLEKEYKGRFLSVHHPDDPSAHDDYPDAWALSEHAKSEALKKAPRLTVF